MAVTYSQDTSQAAAQIEWTVVSENISGTLVSTLFLQLKKTYMNASDDSGAIKSVLIWYKK